MRIVIDMQGAQSTGSRNRGIGRYTLSLALAMARNRNEHEIIIALSGLFPDSIEPIREAFAGILPRENIRVWHAIGPIGSINSANDWRRESAELIRESFLASIRPDMVHVSSLFEGFGDDVATSIGALSQSIPVAVTLYDLIPYIHRQPYLDNPVVEAWYLGKIEHLRRADLWLAISESSRREGVDYLGLPDERSVNISTDADPHFRHMQISSTTEEALRQRYGFTRPFVMYTGGIDYRKNIEGLIRAFAHLPKPLRQQHQLAIVCSVRDEEKRRLLQLAKDQDLTKDDVVLTGFVPEDDLVALYNLCKLFVFPSWHEGFGLPALEAMRCGAPVIGANTSSVPEVIGWKESLFDPHSEEAIAAKIERALTDEVFRTELIRNGNAQSKLFSWDESARRAIKAMEGYHAKHKAQFQPKNVTVRRPTLAYISPLPPEKSGIADYSSELLPELARLYEIDVIVAQDVISDTWINAHCPVRSVQWFAENYHRYQRLLYHFGNSTFHGHMFGLLKAIPGVVVLHDFFLSGILAHQDVYGFIHGCWARELYEAHGYKALYDRFHAENIADVIWKYPCSLSVIQDSFGVIAHSPNSLRLAEKWYGDDLFNWKVIPHLRDSRIDEDKIAARKARGFEANDFLVCSFGILNPTKLNHRLLKAWLKSSLAKDKNCYLIFVGENDFGDYGQKLLGTIRSSQCAKNIRITGWTDMDVFRQYLASSDIGIQLRTLSRGETAGTVLDCMNYGLATIVNANGSMADIDREAVWKLPDEFTDEQLIEALETLWQDKTRRHRMGEAARDIILRNHNPRACADQYGEAIERFYRLASSDLHALPTAIAGLDAKNLDETELIQIADAIARSSIQPLNMQRQLLVDISKLVQRGSTNDSQSVVFNVLREWLSNQPVGLRVEPVYATTDRQGYRYARHFTLGFLDCPSDLLVDEVVEYSVGDIFLGLDSQPDVVTAQQTFYKQLRRQGVLVKFVVYDLESILLPQVFVPGVADQHTDWLQVVAQSDGAICISRAESEEISKWIQANVPDRQARFAVDWLHLGTDVEDLCSSRELPPDSEAVLKAIRAKHPQSDGMLWLAWKEVANQLLGVLLKNDHE